MPNKPENPFKDFDAQYREELAGIIAKIVSRNVAAGRSVQSLVKRMGSNSAAPIHKWKTGGQRPNSESIIPFIEVFRVTEKEAEEIVILHNTIERSKTRGQPSLVDIDDVRAHMGWKKKEPDLAPKNAATKKPTVQNKSPAKTAKKRVYIQTEWGKYLEEIKIECKLSWPQIDKKMNEFVGAEGTFKDSARNWIKRGKIPSSKEAETALFSVMKNFLKEIGKEVDEEKYNKLFLEAATSKSRSSNNSQSEWGRFIEETIISTRITLEDIGKEMGFLMNSQPVSVSAIYSWVHDGRFPSNNARIKALADTLNGELKRLRKPLLNTDRYYKLLDNLRSSAKSISRESQSEWGSFIEEVITKSGSDAIKISQKIKGDTGKENINEETVRGWIGRDLIPSTNEKANVLADILDGALKEAKEQPLNRKKFFTLLNESGATRVRSSRTTIFFDEKLEPKVWGDFLENSIRRAGLSYANLSDKLVNKGVNISSSAVRAWAVNGSVPKDKQTREPDNNAFNTLINILEKETRRKGMDFDRGKAIDLANEELKDGEMKFYDLNKGIKRPKIQKFTEKIKEERSNPSQKEKGV